MVFIINKIFCCQMIPVFQPMYRSGRKPLIKNMVYSIYLTQTIRIIHQTTFRCNVPYRIIRIFPGCLLYPLKIFSRHIRNSNMPVLMIRKIILKHKFTPLHCFWILLHNQPCTCKCNSNRKK